MAMERYGGKTHAKSTLLKYEKSFELNSTRVNKGLTSSTFTCSLAPMHQQ